MIKLKNILNESKFAFDRKFGESLPTLKDVTEKHQIESKEQLNEWGDLSLHVNIVKNHLDVFKSNLDTKAGGSFDSDSYEYEKDRWHNNSKMLKGRDKKLDQWEKKVKKSLDNLIKDFEKAWK